MPWASQGNVLDHLESSSAVAKAIHNAWGSPLVEEEA